MRRAIDIIASGFGGLVLLPIAVLVAAAIRLRLGSPVLFRQTRAGLHGKDFTVLKFRTMRPAQYEAETDLDRDTPLGRRLRTASLDELPQLINVFRGDMSIIGPRPTLPEQVVHYDERQWGRLAIRPGITGWAQVNGRNSISWPERIELDLWYIARRSLRLDLTVLFLTVKNVLKPEGITGEGGVNEGFPLADGTSTSSHAAASAMAEQGSRV